MNGTRGPGGALAQWRLAFLGDLKESLPISVSRSAIPAGSNIILALVGHYSVQTLAELTLLLAMASIFFVISTSGQIGLQAEFARAAADGISAEFRRLLGAALITYGGISAIASLVLTLASTAASCADIGSISCSVNTALPVLSLSIPLLALIAVLTIALEAAGEAPRVARVKLAQLLWQITAVFIVVVREGGVLAIAWAYVSSDLVGLAALSALSVLTRARPSFDVRVSQLGERLLPLKVGVPIVVGQLAQRYSVYVLTAAVARFGAASTSALATAGAVVFFAQVPIVGICQMASIDVARRAQSRMPVNDIVWRRFLNMIVLTVAMAGMVLLGRDFLKFALTADKEAAHIFMAALPYVLVHYVASNCAMYALAVLRSYGDRLWPQLIMAGTMAIAFAGYLDVSDQRQFIDAYVPYVSLFLIAGSIVWIRLYYVQQRDHPRL
ncbi:hypothetical protein CEG14_23215 [Bordetella genomosp. 1]|uniref:Uncharacterized protein n=1 Tax=Bordetella genomosp. 1 TaxID=1395607 RepID=A0A261RVQ3_9BORD|nr:hypothetical protein [Bordetella genomosp. 1]OZI28847.1 hypothetical protein CEG14_23215 [Bordetella genomosp. 1]